MTPRTMKPTLKWFRVEIHRPSAIPGQHQRNPFLRRLDNVNDRTTMLVRSWEMEAVSKDQIRKYFKEAQALKIPNVVGYTLRSIEEI